MSKKSSKQKGSSSSKKKKTEEEIDMSEYEEEYETEPSDKVDYDEYELPEDFEVPDDDDDGPQDDDDLNWFQKRKKSLVEMENTQRLYWIKVLSGVITGLILGLAGAQTGWWLFLMIGVYAVVTAGGFFLFRLEWNWKEILISGFFPFIALFWMFWTLMFTSLYAPENWIDALITTITHSDNTTTWTSTITDTTTAAGFPILSIIFTVIATLAAIQFLLRRQKKLN